MSDEVKRTCANCACFFLDTDKSNPTNKQGFCRRDPATAAQARVEVPRVGKDGQPVMGRDGKPVMNNEVKIVYLYKPMEAGLVCFNGWRAIDTLPGENSSLPFLIGQMKKLWDDVTKPQTPSEFAFEPECAHGQVVGLKCSTCPDGIAEWPKTD